MFSVRNVPIVIEPGVGAIEAEFFTNDKKIGERTIPVQMQRVNLDEKVTETLPFIPCVKFPHVFSLTTDLDKSAILLIYDWCGRLTTVYTRGQGTAWERNDVAEEHAGQTITQFSVRFSFTSAKDRNKFVELLDDLVTDTRNKKTLDVDAGRNVTKALQLLARSRTAPVVLPVAVAKNQLSPATL